MRACPCGSGAGLDSCCGPYVSGEAQPPTAEALMRSRYTAFVEQNVDHLVRTHAHPAPDQLRAELQASMGPQKRWLGLVVHSADEGNKVGYVSFTASCVDSGQLVEIRERSEFRKRKGRWRYVGAVD